MMNNKNKPSVNTDEFSYTVPMGAEDMKTFDNAIKDHLSTMEHIKSVTIEDDEVIKQEFHGDLGELSPDTEEQQYETLMNTFLSRKDKRKLSRYKGFKSFSDRIYGR